MPRMNRKRRAARQAQGQIPELTEKQHLQNQVTIMSFMLKNDIESEDVAVHGGRLSKELDQPHSHITHALASLSSAQVIEQFKGNGRWWLTNRSGAIKRRKKLKIRLIHGVKFGYTS